MCEMLLSHIIPDLWQPRDKASIKNWKTPGMKQSPRKFYTVNKIDIKGLYVNVYIWPGLLCHVVSVSVKVHIGLHFLTSPRSSMLSSSTCGVREHVKNSFDKGSSGQILQLVLGCSLTSGHFSWMTSMMSSVKSPWMMISSSAVTEAPQENFWAKNLWASLRSMSDVDHKMTAKLPQGENTDDRHQSCDYNHSLTESGQATHPCDVFLFSSWDFCYCDFLRDGLLLLFDLTSSTCKGGENNILL